jgi:hypothetical protein
VIAGAALPRGLGIDAEALGPVTLVLLIRAFRRPGVTSDALLRLADVAEEAVEQLDVVPRIQADFLALAELLREIAPRLADMPLPAPSQPALPPVALRAAARVLQAYGTAETAGVERLLAAMAAAQEGSPT